jgi:hypothetical protein
MHVDLDAIRVSRADADEQVFPAAPRRRTGQRGDRKAILLVAGDKSGGSEKRFYKGLIQRADERLSLAELNKTRRKK